MNILRESRICMFFANIFRVLFTAVADSFPARFIKWIAICFSESIIYKGILAVMKGISACFKNCVIYKALFKAPCMRRFMDNSIFFKLWDICSSAVVNFFHKIFASFKKVNTGSVNYKCFSSLKNKLSFENILGLVLLFVVSVPGNLWNNMYSLLFAGGMFALFLICVFSNKQYSLNIRSIGLSMLVFGFAVIFSVVNSLVLSDSIRVLMFFITSFIFMGITGASLNTEEKLDKFLGFIYFGVIITSLFCFVQVAIGIESNAEFVDMNSSGNLKRAFSTFENPNNYAEYLVLFLPFMAAFALNRKTNTQKAVYLLLLILPIAALVLTYSRSCWVTFAIAAVLFILLYDYKLFPYLVVIVLIAIPFLPGTVWNRIMTIGSMKDSSNSYRIEIWTGCVKMVKDWWTTGVGLGPAAFGRIYPGLAVPHAVTAPHSHMLFFEILLEMGIIGLVSFLLWWVSTIKGFITTLVRKENKTKGMRNILIASISSLTGITFVSGVEYIWFYPRMMLMFFVAAGIMIAAKNITRKE